MYIPSRRRRHPRPDHEPAAASSGASSYTYTAVNPFNQAQGERFIEVYRASAARQPVAAGDLERLRVRLAMLDARRARMQGWGVENVLLVAETLATVDKSLRAIEHLYASIDPADPLATNGALRRIYACNMHASLPRGERRSIRRHVVCAIVLETADMLEEDGLALARALVPGAEAAVGVEPPAKRRKLG